MVAKSQKYLLRLLGAIDKLRKLIPDEYNENVSDYLLKQGITHELLGNTHGEN